MSKKDVFCWVMLVAIALFGIVSLVGRVVMTRACHDQGGIALVKSFGGVYCMRRYL